MVEQREITSDYLNLFITSIKRGYSVVFVEGTGMLAVDHPSEGYLVVQLADKVVDTQK